MRSCIARRSCARRGRWKSDVLVVMKRDATKEEIGLQSLTFENFEKLMAMLPAVAGAVGRPVAAAV